MMSLTFKINLSDRLGPEANPRENDPHRPDLRVNKDFWTDRDDNLIPGVSVVIGPLWGQPIRFLSLVPSEARQLAAALIKCADLVDRAGQG